MNIPFAQILRPQSIKDFIGQKHLLADTLPLAKIIANKLLHSMILWGPPGVGKTTLANLITDNCDYKLIKLSAVSDGTKKLREAIQIAKDYQKLAKHLILFVDEVHNFNKTQQDILLPFMESGLIIFIGATTENPAFAINKALLSRLKVYILEALSNDDLALILKRALTVIKPKITITDKAKKQIIISSDGDARRLLNYLQLLVNADIYNITTDDLQLILQDRVIDFNNDIDVFYQQLSAFHKSVRGSSPDGALYWYARMLQAGYDAKVIARRLLAIASEDIGNADPRALEICLNAWDIYHRVGDKEGHRAIAQAVIYCAIASKSNAVYLAFNSAMCDAQKEPHLSVPKHLCNANDKLSEKLARGVGYRYAHNEKDAYARGQKYFPDEIDNREYYQPTNRGLEAKIVKRLKQYKKWDNS